MLVHPAVLAMTVAVPPNPQYADGIDTAPLYRAPQEHHPAIDVDADDVRRQRVEALVQVSGEVRRDDFVGVDAEYPIGAGIELAECPIELSGIVVKCVRKHSRSQLFGDRRSPVARERIHDQYTVDARAETFYTAPDVHLLVERENDG